MLWAICRGNNPHQISPGTARLHLHLFCALSLSFSFKVGLSIKTLQTLMRLCAIRKMMQLQLPQQVSAFGQCALVDSAASHHPMSLNVAAVHCWIGRLPTERCATREACPCYAASPAGGLYECTIQHIISTFGPVLFPFCIAGHIAAHLACL